MVVQLNEHVIPPVTEKNLREICGMIGLDCVPNRSFLEAGNEETARPFRWCIYI